MVLQHATYLPDRHMFAVWQRGDTPAVSIPDAPASAPRHRIALAVPTTDRSAIEVVGTDCVVVDAAALSGDDFADGSASVAAWRAVLAGDGEHRLPVAGHAVPNPSGTSIVSAARARSVFTHTQDVGAELTGTLTATLRPYQLRGIAWLDETVREHSGAVLADEMGLGKTIQAIGHLIRRAGDGPQLVICPTSLVSNWESELDRFAPSLRPVPYRGGALSTLPIGTVVIASYPTLRLHAPHLADIAWETTIFDEAQILKNPRTQVAKAARALNTGGRIALTGTPVENHPDELWAILHLVCPKLVGHRSQFRRRFGRPIMEGSAAAIVRLREAIAPVLLARSKSDVAEALPPKIHIDLICDLTDEQQQLYDAQLAEAVDAGFGEGLQRHGRVLAALTRLKQVCNHPGLINGGLAELADRSGKLDLCTDIIADHLENDSPTLVFTQYRQTGELLVRHFADALDEHCDFFHGGLSANERARMVADFQRPDGPKILVISLKAGGTGLTLTRAAHVIHFDRWWNPAVEAQATDRAHRIGQEQTVTVTTLTSATTLEEHIAQMHRRKGGLRQISGAIGGSDELTALANLDDEQLIAVLTRKR